MLDPKFRARVGSFLKRRIEKFDLDSPMASDDELFQGISQDFNNLLCACKNPRQEQCDRLDGRESWDPNNGNVAIQMRNGPWINKMHNNRMKKYYGRESWDPRKSWW